MRLFSLLQFQNLERKKKESISGEDNKKGGKKKIQQLILADFPEK